MPRSLIGAVLRYVALGPDPEPHAGFGQSLADDVRFALRFRRCYRLSADWRAPTGAEARQIETHPIVGRFGDVTLMLADVDRRLWILRERDWHGWPDPPHYVFFALDSDDVIWAARDFDGWPSAWTPKPPR